MKIQTLCWTLLLLTSCEFHSTPKKNILVIAVENLGSTEISCHRNPIHEVGNDFKTSSEPKRHNESGFENLCQNFVQFTRSYTPSVLSLPAITSLLTATHPYSHGVRTNSDSLTPADHETVAELAHDRGWVTAFFSGGAPILRKSGLSQGFDIFDDSVKISWGHLYRPLRELNKLYLQFRKETKNQNTLAFLTVQDLLFPEEATVNSVGEMRSLSFESQLEEVDEKLGSLLGELQKNSENWNNTTIVVLGLNGASRSMRKIQTNENLFSERSQVSLFYKPASRIEKSNVEFPVSLVDLGNTLFELIGVSQSDSEIPSLKLESLQSLARAHPDREFRSRVLPVEGQRRISSEKSKRVWGFRTSSTFCIKADPWQCYDTRTDHLEQELNQKLPVSILELTADLNQLKTAIESAGEFTPPKALFRREGFDICQLLLKASSSAQINLKSCPIPEIQELAAWIEAEENPKIDSNLKEILKKKFFLSYSWLQLDLQIAQMNERKNFLFETNTFRENELKLVSEILESKRFQKYKALAHRSQQNTLKGEVQND